MQVATLFLNFLFSFFCLLTLYRTEISGIYNRFWILFSASDSLSDKEAFFPFTQLLGKSAHLLADPARKYNFFFDPNYRAGLTM
jgi:hypothetical protein